MSDQNKLAYDYVAQLDPTIQEIPRTLLISELISAGLDADAPLILCISSMDESSIDIATLKGLTELAPMELTEGDKKLFSSIMDPMLPEKKVLISMWKSQLSELELAHAHPFMQDIFNRQDSAELTREQVHKIAIESGLELSELRIPKAARDAVKTQTDTNSLEQKEGQGREIHVQASTAAISPEQTASRPESSLADTSKQPSAIPSQPQPKHEMFSGGPQGHATPMGQAASTGLGSIISDVADITGKILGTPFAVARSAYNKANSVKIAPGRTTQSETSANSVSGADNSVATQESPGSNKGQGRAIAEEITALTQQLRENPSPEAVESITQALSAASEKIGDVADMSEDDEVALKEAMVSLKEAAGEDLADDGMSEEEKTTFKDLLIRMTKALMALFAKLFGKSKEAEERIEPTLA